MQKPDQADTNTEWGDLIEGGRKNATKHTGAPEDFPDTVTIIDIGDSVVCDFCNDDYTDSEEHGGALIGSYALCPKCAAKNPTADAKAPLGMTFKDWVLQLRGGDNTISITKL